MPPPTQSSAPAIEHSKNSQLPSKEAAVDNLNAFATDGANILSSKIGDLNGDGKRDAIVVLDPPSKGDERAGQGSPRTVLLLVRDAAGQLQEVARNDKVVPCSKCGGLLGDPFGSIRIDKNGFTVLIEGGSSQRWHSEYLFQYSPQSNGWHLQQVERGAFDTISEKKVSKTFTPADFGQVNFQNFDPSSIPEVVLP